MSDSHSDRPARRPRYHGTHPRQFHEKYKEHQPALYPQDVEKVLNSGKTPAGMHRCVMVPEVLQALALRPGNLAVDCTVGYGGHAREIYAAVQPGGRLLGFDVDPLELPKTEARLRESVADPQSFKLWRRNFAGIAQTLAEEAPEGVDAIFADLGVSSMQLDDPSRGFGYKFDGPLDMRMNPSRGMSAVELLSRIDSDKLARCLQKNSDEPLANELAQEILVAHAQNPLLTTSALRNAVSQIAEQLGGATEVDATVRRVFQALRIAVNDELGALESFLRQAPGCLKPGGRLAVLTFHSGEDRRVKVAFKQGLHDGVFDAISQNVVRASATEQHGNPRSSSAKLRFAVRSAGQQNS